MTQNICGLLDDPLETTLPPVGEEGCPNKTFEPELVPKETDEPPADQVVVIIPVVVSSLTFSIHSLPYNSLPLFQEVHLSAPFSHVLQSSLHFAT